MNNVNTTTDKTEPHKIYLLLTDTSSLLSKSIKLLNHQQYNHISLAFNPELSEVYSFGRLKPSNPVIGGFVQEDLTHAFFRSAGFQLYELSVSNEQYNGIRLALTQFQKQKDNLHYNFLGLLPAYVNVAWERPNHFFCSEFVSSLLQEVGIIQKDTPSCLMRPQDVVIQTQANLLYEGTIGDYLKLDSVQPLGDKRWNLFPLREDIG